MPERGLPLFSLDLIDGWEDQSAYVFVGPKKNEFQHILILTLDRHPAERELEAFGRQRATALVGTLDGPDKVKEEIITLPSGREAYEYVYKWVASGDLVLFKRIVCLLIDKIGYVFTVDFTRSSIKTTGLEVMQIIDSLTPFSRKT